MIQLHDKILEIINNKCYRTFLIAIDGFGCSGKTTYADELRKFLKTHGKTIQLLHIDDFIYPVKIRYNNQMTLSECYYNIQFRYNYLKEKVLEPIKNGKYSNTEVEIYDKSKDAYYMEQINLSPDVCIVEGVFLQRPELKYYFDLIIYIDIDRTLQLERAKIRGNNGKDEKEIMYKYKEKYNPAEDMYMHKCKPKDNADFIIDAEKFELIKSKESNSK